MAIEVPRTLFIWAYLSHHFASLEVSMIVDIDAANIRVDGGANHWGWVALGGCCYGTWVFQSHSLGRAGYVGSYRRPSLVGEKPWDIAGQAPTILHIFAAFHVFQFGSDCRLWCLVCASHHVCRWRSPDGDIQPKATAFWMARAEALCWSWMALKFVILLITQARMFHTVNGII